MRILNTLSVILLIYLSGCGGLKVETDYETDYNYAELKYYQWADIYGNEKDNILANMPDLYKRVRIAVNRTLEMKGYKITVKNRPDFLVDVYLSIDEIEVIVDNRPGGRGNRGNLNFSENFMREGTLIVDIISPEDKFVIWRGVATDQVSDPDEQESKEIKQRRADHIIYQVLQEFPPETN